MTIEDESGYKRSTMIPKPFENSIHKLWEKKSAFSMHIVHFRILKKNTILTRYPGVKVASLMGVHLVCGVEISITKGVKDDGQPAESSKTKTDEAHGVDAVADEAEG